MAGEFVSFPAAGAGNVCGIQGHRDRCTGSKRNTNFRTCPAFALECRTLRAVEAAAGHVSTSTRSEGIGDVARVQLPHGLKSRRALGEHLGRGSWDHPFRLRRCVIRHREQHIGTTRLQPLRQRRKQLQAATGAALSHCRAVKGSADRKAWLNSTPPTNTWELSKGFLQKGQLFIQQYHGRDFFGDLIGSVSLAGE